MATVEFFDIINQWKKGKIEWKVVCDAVEKYSNSRPSLWAFMYNSCIHESSWATVSLHYSKEGAEKALAEHKAQALKQWQQIVDSDEDKGTEFGYDVISPFGIHEDWCVQEVEVLP